VFRYISEVLHHWQANALAYQWCIRPPICTSTASFKFLHSKHPPSPSRNFLPSFLRLTPPNGRCVSMWALLFIRSLQLYMTIFCLQLYTTIFCLQLYIIVFSLQLYISVTSVQLYTKVFSLQLYTTIFPSSSTQQFPICSCT